MKDRFRVPPHEHLIKRAVSASAALQRHLRAIAKPALIAVVALTRTHKESDAPVGSRSGIFMTAEEIGAAVRQARLAQGLRQDQLAAAAGVGLRFLVELKGGKPTVRLDRVLAVLDVVACRLEVTQPATL